jgi:hypothetical protein
MKARLFSSDVIYCISEVQAELSRPLKPAPITFMMASRSMINAQQSFDELAQLCKRHDTVADLHRLYSVSAFHLVLGYSLFGIVSSRLQFPAKALVQPDIARALNQGELVYQIQQSFASKHSESSESRSFLAKSASALSAAYIDLGDEEQVARFCKDLAMLVAEYPREAELRVELARAKYNLVSVLKNMRKVWQATDCYRDLCTLAKEHPTEEILAEKRDNAADLLGLFK